MCQRVGLSTLTPHLHDVGIESRLKVALRAKHHDAVLLQEGRFTTFEVALAHESIIHCNEGEDMVRALAGARGERRARIMPGEELR